MSDTTEMTRRNFVSGTATGLSVGFAGGMSTIFTDADDSVETIDISVFIGDELASLNDGLGFDDSERFDPARRTAEHIEYSFTKLVETFDEPVDVDVSVVESEVPVSDFERGSEGTLLGAWESYIESDVSAEMLGDDTNLLLTTKDTSGKRSSWRGNASVPCRFCDGGDHTAAVVYGVTQFPFLMLDAGEIKETYTGWGKLGRIPIAIHEVGHTLGLSHENGNIVSDTKGRPKISPMMTALDIDGEGYRSIEFNSDSIERDDLQLSGGNAITSIFASLF